MKTYFQLQYLMINRRFKDAGIEPILAYCLLAIGFTALSVYLFYKTQFANYVYIVAAFSITSNLSAKQRTEFLQTCFGDKKFRQIRMMENLLCAVPFVLFLIYKQLFLYAGIVVVQSMVLALVHYRTSYNVALPTPFSKKPFEFSTGFRNSFYLLAAAYALAAIAMAVRNYNLGLFAMLLVFAITLSYYSKPEPEYYVWIFDVNAKQFLFQKINTALLFASLLAAPVALAIGISFHQHAGIPLLLFVAALALLVCTIVSKYTAFPNEISLAQGIVLALCISFPPLLIVMIPFLFQKSKARLNYLLP